MRPHKLLRLLVILMATPLAALAVWSLQHTARELMDPCIAWESGSSNSFSGSAAIAPGDPCRMRGVNGQSRATAETIAVLVPGGMLAGAILAIAGALRRRPRMLFGAALFTLAETVGAFSIFPLTLLAGAVFLTAYGILQDPA